MAVDAPSRAASREGDARVADKPLRKATSYAVGSGGVSLTRVGSGSRLRSNGTPPWLWRTTRRGTAPGVDSSRTCGRGLRSSPIHPVRGRVSPCPSWTALPSRRPSAGCGPYEAAAMDRQPGYPRTPATARGLVDKCAALAARARRRRLTARSASRDRGGPTARERLGSRSARNRAERLQLGPFSWLKAPTSIRRRESRRPRRVATPARAGRARRRSRRRARLATSRSPPIRRARSRAIGSPRPVPVIRSWSAIR